MIINDLSYLEAIHADAQATANAQNHVVGGDYDFNTSLDFSSNIQIYKEVYIDVYISSNADIQGNVAIAEASANAIGKDTFTEVYVSTYTDGYSSHSSATAKSVTRG